MRRNVLLPMLSCCLLAGVVCAQTTPPKAPAGPPDFKKLPLYKQVEIGIDCGKKKLWESQLPNGSWPGYGKNPVNGKVEYPVGPTAIVVYALLESGESYQTPKMKKALEFLSQTKASKTYELGLRCNVWLLANSQAGAGVGKFNRQLKDDAELLVKSHGNGSYNYDCVKVPHPGDNSNSQYGVLGMWAAARSTYEVPDEYWWKVMRHWMDCQNVDGGWGYARNNPTSGTMTAAGVATLFVCYDYLFSGSFMKCNNTNDFKPIQRGLDWFDQNFEGMLNGKVAMTSNVGDWFYLFYGIERVGLASGYKYFGTADWYKLGADRLLAAMQAVKWDERQGWTGGGWSGGLGGADVSTSFSLLFLVRGQNAVIFNKLEFPSIDSANKPVPTDWRCRPRDLAMLTGWLSRQFEQTMNWQIINLKVPVKEWHDAPILYIAGSLEPKLTDQDIAKLRQYVMQGGMIFSCTECGPPGSPASSKFATGMRDIYKRLLPEYEMVDVPSTHDLYSKTLNFPLPGKPKLSMITNGIRPLVIHTDEDLPKDWQLNRLGTNLSSFQIAANLFMYVTDKGKLRTRASHTWPDAVTLPNARGSLKICRVKWGEEKSTRWNPEPLGLERFTRLFSADQNIDLKLADPVPVGKLAGCDSKVAILSGIGALKLDPADIDAIKGYVSKGNMLLIEAAGGDKQFYDSAIKLLENSQAYGSGNVRILADSAGVYNVKIPDGRLHVSKDKSDPTSIRYRSKTISRLTDRKELPLRAVIIKDKPAILVSREDISNAGAVGYQMFGVDGYDPGSNVEGSAYRVLRNIVLYAAYGVDGSPAAGTKPPDNPPAKPPATGPATPPATKPATDPTKPPPGKLFPD